jgi:hypothetical protein
LNDRNGRVLDEDEVYQYQKYIKALVVTDGIMKELFEVFGSKDFEGGKTTCVKMD